PVLTTITQHPPSSTLFPYTTLFRSCRERIESRLFGIKFLAKVNFIRVALANMALQFGKCSKICRFVHAVFQPAFESRRIFYYTRGMDLIYHTLRVTAGDFDIEPADEQCIFRNERVRDRKSV